MYRKKLLLFASLSIFTFSLLILSMPLTAQAQTGSIKGVIKDKISTDVVIGANVAIKGGSQGSSTDIEGAFLISKVAEGTYTIVITSIGYKPLEIPDVKVESGKVAVIETFIEEDVKGLEAVVVTAKRETNTVVSLIKDIRVAEQVVVGISSEQISKTQDRDASQVVRRIPGVSVIGDRFIMVRGLAERYNAVMLNDILTPSSEVDSRAFSFDAIPSGAINRILIFKSPSAELPGDFSGGVVKIFTKEATEDNSTEFSISTGIRQATTFTNQFQYKGGSTDFLGFDDGTRRLPSSFPSFLSGSFQQRAQAANELPNNWTASPSNVSLDLRLSLSLTRNLGKFSNFTALSYSNTNQFTKVDFDRFNDFDINTQKSDPFFRYIDDQMTNNIRIGVLHNWSYKISDRSRIDFRNLFNQIGISQTVQRDGTRFTEGVDSKAYSFRYETRSIYSGQFTGKHSFGEDDKAVLTWQAGFGYTSRQEPDWRRFRTQRQQNSTSERFGVVIPPGPTTFDAARFYSNLTETVITGAANYERKVQLGRNDALISKLRTGFYVERKDRDFSARWMSYIGTPNLDGRLLTESLDQIFSPANVNGTTGFTMSEGTKPNDQYKANMTLAAAYVGASIPFSKEFTASFGVRGEFSQQVMDSRDFGGSPQNADLVLFQPLPSVNLSYNFSEKSLFRASYGMTLNRPEFRELAPFLFYDFNFDVAYIGNPNVRNSTVQNVDLRWEYYPSASEVINIGAFYKSFDNPIELKSIITGSARTFNFVNAPGATSYGVELEIRKSLHTITQNKYLQNLFIVGNASLIRSRVDFGSLATSQDQTRPMMNQSPYLVNLGLFYNNDDTKFQWNVMYNIFGPRIFVVGDIQAQTIYEMPRHAIDISFTKGIGNRFELKGGIQDILNAKYKMTQDSNLDGKITSVDEQVLGYRRGSYLTLGLSYRISK
jgi:TonB-dependent receptor